MISQVDRLTYLASIMAIHDEVQKEENEQVYDVMGTIRLVEYFVAQIDRHSSIQVIEQDNYKMATHLAFLLLFGFVVDEEKKLLLLPEEDSVHY